MRMKHFTSQQRSFSFLKLKLPEVKRLHEPTGSAVGLSLSRPDDARIDCCRLCCLNSLTLISISAYHTGALTALTSAGWIAALCF